MDLRLLIMMFLAFIFSMANVQAEKSDASYIIVNKQYNQLVYIENGNIVLQTKIATGRTKELTPEGLFTITVKAKNPYYRKKDIPGGDPQNPLGSRWIGFNARNTDGRIYGLHGTNRPNSIGLYVSNGCIRLPKEALETLYDKVSSGTKVYITHSPKSMIQIAKDIGAL